MFASHATKRSYKCLRVCVGMYVLCAGVIVYGGLSMLLWMDVWMESFCLTRSTRFCDDDE